MAIGGSRSGLPGVQSYITSDQVTGNPMVLNVTLPGHPLFPGVVARYVSTMADGATMVNNVGEGSSQLQAIPLLSDVINGQWTSQTQGIIDGISGGQSSQYINGSAAGGFLLYPNKSNNNQMQSVYTK